MKASEWKLVAVAAAVLVSGFAYAGDSSPSGLVKLQKFTPPSMIKIKGRIVSLDKNVLNFGQPGQTELVADTGSIIEGCIYNRQGEVVKNGTLIAQQYTSYEKPSYEAAKRVYEGAMFALKQAKIDYERNERLVKSNSVSRKVYLKSKTDYMMSESALYKAYEDLVSAEAHYNADFIYSSFSGIVTSTYQYPGGWYDKFKDVATVLMLDPVAVRITIPPEYYSNIDHVYRTPVIYSSGREVIKDWIAEWYNVEDGRLCVYFLIENPQVSIYKSIPAMYQKLPKIGWPVKVVDFDESSGKQGIPLDSLYPDKDGHEYAWKLTPKNIEPGNTTYTTFEVNKVKVAASDKVKYYSRTKFIELNDPGTLKKGDMIVCGTIPEGLMDKGMVLEDPHMWRYMPDEEVTAQIPIIPQKEAYYIPSTALTINDEGKWYVTLENGEKVIVDVTANFAGYSAVAGSRLSPGLKIQANPEDVDTIKQQIEALIKNN